jgi:hypothetical protein
MTSEKGVAESSFTKKHELHLATLQMAAVESMEKKYRKGSRRTRRNKVVGNAHRKSGGGGNSGSDRPTHLSFEPTPTDALDYGTSSRRMHGRHIDKSPSKRVLQSYLHNSNRS